jgi:hypothetical protein
MDSLFDSLEDLDAKACIEACRNLQLAELAHARAPSQTAHAATAVAK